MKRRKVLLVCKAPGPCQGKATLLTRGGYDVTQAYGEQQALEKAGAARPDLILLDGPHHGDDSRFARELSEHADTRSIPIVAIQDAAQAPASPRRGEPGPIRRFIYWPCLPRTFLEGIGDVLRWSH